MVAGVEDSFYSHMADKEAAKGGKSQLWAQFERPTPSNPLLPARSHCHNMFTTLEIVPKLRRKASKLERMRETSDSNWDHSLTPIQKQQQQKKTLLGSSLMLPFALSVIG